MNFTNSHNNETFYSLLNVDNNASQEDIKKAYRKLSLELHPDRNKGDNEKAEKFKKISTAYNTLSNPNERAQYDSSLTFNNLNLPDNVFMNMLFNPIDINAVLNDLKQNGFTKGSHHAIPVDLFSKFSMSPTFMQGMNNFEFDSKPKTIHQTISISLLDSYKGCKLPLSIKRKVCENNIYSEQEETIYIDIPKGVDNNEIITVKEKGNKVSNNKGDVEVKVIINNDTHFERNGIDLIYKKTITLKESLCGFSFDIKYIDGREFRINNESGNIIPHDFRKTISGFGINRDNHIGDLIIIFNIKYPKSLTTQQIDQLNTIL